MNIARDLAALEREAAQAEDRADEATIAQAHQDLSQTLAAEDAAWDAAQVAPDATSPEYRAGWAAEDARQRGEDGGTAPADEMSAFTGRLADWLRSQPDVAEVDVVADGGNDTAMSSTILGFSLAGVGGVSLGMNITP
jgi:hypothetical protein